ncbi:hypothetical protein HZA86_00760 [Candidatus Uhrbacteria bacterium]|nr:hypothetical protein [Candidatus Uhrbacteria bacterium]
MEQLLQQWGQQERNRYLVDLDASTSIRVWNAVQARLSAQALPNPVTIRHSVWARWTFLVPAFATMALVLFVTREGQQQMPVSQEPPMVVAQNLPSIALEKEPSASQEFPLEPEVVPSSTETARSNTRTIIASRGQSVFVAWGVSVYGPQNATGSQEVNPQSLWAQSVY